jgi:hypothetical protein
LCSMVATGSVLTGGSGLFTGTGACVGGAPVGVLQARAASKSTMMVNNGGYLFSIVFSSLVTNLCKLSNIQEQISTD